MYKAVAGAVLVAAAAVLARLTLIRKPPKRALPIRSDEELEDALAHIAYERFALDRALRAFLQPGHRRFDLEAALMHARNLTEFFWAPVRGRLIHEDGVYAGNYLAAKEAWRPGDLPQLPNMRYNAMSAQLAHISIKRTTSGDPRDFAAEIPAIAAQLDMVWDRWRGRLRDTAWDSLLQAAVDRWPAAP